VFVEVKTAEGTLTPDEAAWMLRHPDAMVRVVRTLDDCLRLRAHVMGEE